MTSGVEITTAADDDVALATRARRALAWLFDAALPVSWTHGRNPSGGWHDRLDDDLRPTDAPMRLLVQTRQVFVFAEAGRLGWTGPWREAMAHGLAFIRDRATSPDGRLARTFDGAGGVLDPRADLYTQAFVLLAYAVAYEVSGDVAHRDAGRALRADLERQAALSDLGFADGDPADLRANPNMHLFEAFLHWARVDGDPVWRTLADGQARLCRERLVDPQTAALREVFVETWRPAPGATGACTEPGHHYEWGWLLLQHGSSSSLPGRLCGRAERLGVDPERQVAVNTITVDGVVLDDDARLWPQTERLKAALAMRRFDPRWARTASAAHDALFRYTEPAPQGLWRDVMRPDGTLRAEAAPISSLYHITGAISELARATGVVQPRW